jgi:NADPH-dependent glutamate synthase beta subunit-like oxidoreductase
MGLLKKDGKKKPLKAVSRGGPGGGVSAARPQQAEKLPPCTGACPSGNDIRGWLTIIAQREKTGLTLEQACEQAWRLEVETNPFPSVMGRVCPHPCEGKCNRTEKDAAVAINSVERFFGDFALQHKLALTKIEGAAPTGKKVAVVGAGPSGLSCAYQLVRRGHEVTVFEELPKAGGMLRYGIPEYRLPRDVLDGEVQRIVDLGVQLRCGSTIGKDVTLDQLRNDYDAVFVGIGAHMGKKVGIPGEEGPGVYTGTEFLRLANSGETVAVGNRVIVVGGGDTAVDAARMSLRVGHDAAGVLRRKGSDVTILYRRTRKEMPAIDREIEEALEEDINLVFLAAPAKILRDDAGNVRGMLVQKMELGEPDSSGRRRPVPIEGDVEEIEADRTVAPASRRCGPVVTT